MSKVFLIHLFIGIVILIGLLQMPIEYYQFLRWSVCLGSAFLLYMFIKRFNWRGPIPTIYLAAIILFNPISPFYLSRPNWRTIDLAYFFLLVFAVYQWKHLDSKIEQEEKNLSIN